MAVTDGMPPPSTVQKSKVKNPIGLLFEIVILIITFWISIFKSIYHIFVPIEEKDLTGQVVLITGTGRGLGRELALTFASKGCKVACAEIQTELNDETVKLLNEKYPNSCSKGYYCDVGKYQSCAELKKEVFADFGRVDILVNNAGIVVGGSILTDYKQSLYEGVAKINFLSHIWMCQTFLPEMVERNSGHIVTISSMSALVGLANASVYAACKWAVSGFIESVREETRMRNPNNQIQFSIACPYFINTSAHYVQNWDCRFAELTVEKAATEIVKGVRQNKFTFSIPSDQYLPAVFVKMVPQEVKDKFCDIFFAKVNDTKTEDVKQLPNYKIVTGELSKKTY